MFDNFIHLKWLIQLNSADADFYFLVSYVSHTISNFNADLDNLTGSTEVTADSTTPQMLTERTPVQTILCVGNYDVSHVVFLRVAIGSHSLITFSEIAQVGWKFSSTT